MKVLFSFEGATDLIVITTMLQGILYYSSIFDSSIQHTPIIRWS
jgi:hypothetical protein